MYLPIFTIIEDENILKKRYHSKLVAESDGLNGTTRVYNYYLFSDVLCGITHLSTEYDIKLLEDIKGMNVNNKFLKEIKAYRIKQIQNLPDIEQIKFNSSHFVIIEGI